jgi:hypothetical protein
MKTPLDCQLLSMGIKFVQAMKDKNLGSIPCEDCQETVQTLMENEVYKSLLENLCTMHAIVTDENQPKIFLQFYKNEKEKFCQTLICSRRHDTLSIQVLLFNRGQIFG